MERLNSGTGRRMFIIIATICSIALLVGVGSNATPSTFASIDPGSEYAQVPDVQPESSSVRKLCENAHLYNYFLPAEGRRLMRIVHEGHGFRVFEYGQERSGLRRVWAYGYSAEDRDMNGWILEKHLCN